MAGLQLPYKAVTPVAATAGDARPLRLAVAEAALYSPTGSAPATVQLGSRDRTRTYTNPVNSRTLCQLSYPGMRRLSKPVLLPAVPLAGIEAAKADLKGRLPVPSG